jgi:hypothetical protein
MMNGTLFFRLLLIVSTALASHTMLMAQESFKVLAVRGAVTIGKSDQLKVGQQLKAADQIKIGASAYVSLAHKNGKTVELRKAGLYKVKDLDASASQQTGSATSKYAKYVVAQLTEVDEPIEFRDARRSHMRTTGSVDRAVGDDVQFWDSVLAIVGGPGELQALAVKDAQSVSAGDRLAVIMPRHTRLLADSVAFAWHPSPKTSSYKVVIVDRTNAVVHSFTTPDTQYVRSLASLGLVPGNVYYWHVESAADASYKTDEYALLALAGEERQSTESLIREVASEFDSEDAAIGKLILAAAFEEMGLFYDAYRSYRSAVELAPDVQNYKRMYAEFLQRQGLNYEAYAAYR